MDYDVREVDPFQNQLDLNLSTKEHSPSVTRLRILWHHMRSDVIAHFPSLPNSSVTTEKYLETVEEMYAQDAYHSLSIEGYKVNLELIERVKTGNWAPDLNARDGEHKNALAARGYWQAFQLVKESVRKVLEGENPGVIAEKDHNLWFRELFAPSITAGILQPSDLIGYRNHPVYIRRSMHVPPSAQAVYDLMPCFFELLKEEKDSNVRVILGHFFFVYIHPYMDGNGRIGRFLMNVMFAAEKFSWTIIPVEQRQKYINALEAASVEQNIIPFCQFIKSLI